jgi:hypothetical protein
VQLALQLLDAGGARAEAGAADSGAALGADVLHALFVRADAVRGEVLEQVLARIVTRADAAARAVALLARCAHLVPTH